MFKCFRLPFAKAFVLLHVLHFYCDDCHYYSLLDLLFTLVSVIGSILVYVFENHSDYGFPDSVIRLFVTGVFCCTLSVLGFCVNIHCVNSYPGSLNGLTGLLLSFEKLIINL